MRLYHSFAYNFQYLLLVLLLSTTGLKSQYNKYYSDSSLNHLTNYHIVDRNEAVGQCIDLVNAYEEMGEVCKQIEALSFLSILYTSISDLENSKRSNIEARRLLDNSECDEQYQVYLSLSDSYIFLDMGEYAKSDSVILASVAMYEHGLSDTITLIKLLMNLGKYGWPLEKIKPYLDRALNLAIQIANEDYHQKVLVDLGTIHAIEGQNEVARKYMLKAMAIARKRNDMNSLAVLYNNLAGLSESDEEILVYIDSALYYAERDQNLINLHAFTENKAYYFLMINQPDSAYHYLWEATLLKDSLWNIQKFEAVAEMEHKYEAEKRTNEIQELKLENLEVELDKANYKKNQDRLIVGSILFLGLAGFFGYRFVTVRKTKNILAYKNDELFKAHKLSDQLLLNILPEQIAKELKEHGKAKAQLIESTTILFSDLIEFTKKATHMDTHELVEELNYCFKGFDEIMDKYGIEKIKTIGDAYMAAGGLPVPKEDSVKSTVLAALEMQDFIKERNAVRCEKGKTSFEMRVGIHTGPVVAGIVGLKKFQYDIWGDSVNTASRLESTGQAGQVNISQNTYDYLKNDPMFCFTSRGKIMAKGKGEIAMYFVGLA